jgi:hypothetical protein
MACTKAASRVPVHTHDHKKCVESTKVRRERKKKKEREGGLVSWWAAHSASYNHGTITTSQGSIHQVIITIPPPLTCRWATTFKRVVGGGGAEKRTDVRAQLQLHF